MKTVHPVLYAKVGCPWCAEARHVLASAGVTFSEKNVTVDPSAFAEMRRLSGQTSAPVLDWDGTILADFGAEELKPFLAARQSTAPTPRSACSCHR
jgi:glutaredoxin